jgi:ATP-dependent Clp protease ATP-binding subunit ClpC
MAIVFNYHSPRSQKARIALALSPAILVYLTILSLGMAVAGIGLLLATFAIGWAVLGASVIPIMIIEWRHGELSHIPVEKDLTIDAVLSDDILGMLSDQPTPYDVALHIGRLNDGQFFAVRFGIGNGFLQEIASKNAADIAELWQESFRIKDEVKSEKIHAGILIVAIIRIYPGYEQLLARIQMSIEDLMYGILWLDHIDDLITDQKQPRLSGGIARDWSFGWIPLLSRFGQNVSQPDSSLLKLATHTEALDSLIHVLGGSGRGNAVLVGPSGVGKTEIIRAFASTLMNGTSYIPTSLAYRQVFVLSAASLISAAPGKGELENLITGILNEAFKAKNIIICLDDAQLFFEEGIGSVNISSMLLPVIKAGRLPMILTMDDQRFLKIGQSNPDLINSLTRITIPAADKDETMAVMRDQLISIEYRRKVTYMYAALMEAYRLSERYIHDLAMPGRALTLLESAAEYAEGRLVTAASVQQAIEQTVDVKVGVASGDQERAKLLNLETLIHERMINQKRAVSVVSDAVRRARAGVRNQDRPIGTFLFLGPTGVGKTELAKALAGVYFGGEDHMIRLDMNEFVSANDVSRLIADGADDASSLTAQVMKQPFSVILLDEIEKAHPSVLTTFLQVLDEGILRDIKNREVSFRDAIIIATSNAGAERIQEYIERGLDIEQFEDQFISELISSNQFRPEFLNRFDEIVMFRPLKKDELVKVVDLMIDGVNKTLSLQKISVEVSQEAKMYLVDAGYDPRLGARPMRRIVQKAVENTVAKQMLSGSVESGGTISIGLEQVKSIVSTKNKADAIARI